MSRDTSGNPGDVRKSALWGSGNRGGEHRSNTLWGKGGRGVIVTLVTGLVLSVAAGAASVQGAAAGAPALPATYLEPGLLERAQQNPTQMFKVIIQSTVAAATAVDSFDAVEKEDDRALQLEADAAHRAEQTANGAESKARSKLDREKARSNREQAKQLRSKLQGLRHSLRGDLEDRFDFIKGVSVEMAGRRLAKLARKPGLIVTEDVQVTLASSDDDSSLIWPAASGILPLRGTAKNPAPKAPAIAIVDSGIDKNRADFANGSRVIAHASITTLKPNSDGDGRGHGTFVASIAAGSNPGRLGASPSSPLVDVDVMDDNGMARTSDVIAGAEWIYEHRQSLNIRVANFSLHSARPSNFTTDPLDRAVEKLWFGGVVVVVAAGNYGIEGGPSGVKFSPGNDPFVITVGALDLNGDLKPKDHDVPSWSAYGRTFDGFMKPDISAAGRYMIGAIPSGSTLASLKASNMLGNGYIRLSGTSFAAPVVAGAAAEILARHPEWTPDQVKGALMQTARRLSPHEVPAGAGGVGEINAWKASELRNPPNPNKALKAFVRTDGASGVPAFDAVSWADAAKASVSWDAVSWADVSWSDVSWADVSWSDVSWADVSWADVLAVADVSWEDNAGDTTAPAEGEYVMTPEELEAALMADPDLFPPAEPVVQAVNLVVGAASAVTAPVAPVIQALPALPALPVSPAPTTP
jgi:serine protease AprX